MEAWSYAEKKPSWDHGYWGACRPCSASSSARTMPTPPTVPAAAIPVTTLVQNPIFPLLWLLLSASAAIVATLCAAAGSACNTILLLIIAVGFSLLRFVGKGWIAGICGRDAQYDLLCICLNGKIVLTLSGNPRALLSTTKTSTHTVQSQVTKWASGRSHACFVQPQ